MSNNALCYIFLPIILVIAGFISSIVIGLIWMMIAAVIMSIEYYLGFIVYTGLMIYNIQAKNQNKALSAA